MAEDSLSVSGVGPPTQSISLIRLIFSCMVAGGVQYGWALQLSLLTPYVQVLCFVFLRIFLFSFFLLVCKNINLFLFLSL